MSKQNQLSKRSFNSGIDMIVDTSQILLEGWRDILKGNDFEYNSVMRSEVSNTKKPKSENNDQMPKVLTAGEATEEEKRIEENNERFFNQNKSKSDEQKEIRNNKFKEIDAVEAAFFAYYPGAKTPDDVTRYSDELDKFKAKLKFNYDGTAKNRLAIEEEIKQKYKDIPRVDEEKKK